MTVINTNSASNITQNALRINQRNMETAMQRLSTGKRINSGSDDPAGISISARMESASRASRTSVRNVMDAISMLQTITAAGTTIKDILLRMGELAQQATSGTNNVDDLLALDSEYNALGLEWQRIAQQTQWNIAAGQNGRMQTGTDTILYYGGQASTLILNTWLPTAFNATATIRRDNIGAAELTAQNTGTVNTVQAATEAFNFARSRTNVYNVNNSRADSHIQSSVAAQGQIVLIARALNGAAAELSLMGSYVNSLNHASDNETAVANGMEVSRSRIEDADYAVETTELSRTQIIAQAATAMLAQANAAKQTVMALLQ
jgi:flagellin